LPLLRVLRTGPLAGHFVPALEHFGDSPLIRIAERHDVGVVQVSAGQEMLGVVHLAEHGQVETLVGLVAARTAGIGQDQQTGSAAQRRGEKSTAVHGLVAEFVRIRVSLFRSEVSRLRLRGFSGFILLAPRL
jgi:hypothetical protein